MKSCEYHPTAGIHKTTYELLEIILKPVVPYYQRDNIFLVSTFDGNHINLKNNPKIFICKFLSTTREAVIHKTTYELLLNIIRLGVPSLSER
jgi:hypothetical protein